MTQKRRSKVRAEPTPAPPPASFDEQHPVEPKTLPISVESLPPGMAAPDQWGRYRMVNVVRIPPPELEGDNEPDEETKTEQLIDPAKVEHILACIERDPKLREAIAGYMATHAAISEANGGEVKYLSAMRAEMDAQQDRAEGRVARAIAPDLTLILGELWTVRLAKMADAAGVMPTQYLQRLLARAWTAMPSRSRVGE